VCLVGAPCLLLLFFSGDSVNITPAGETFRQRGRQRGLGLQMLVCIWIPVALIG